MSSSKEPKLTMASLLARIEKLEGETADTGTYGQRLHRAKEELASAIRGHKEDVRSMLARHSDERAELEKKVEEHFNVLGQGVNMIHAGLNRLEARTNVIWNTFNALVRMIERVWAGSDPVPETREVFEALFKASGRQVYTEAMDHEKSELARLRAEKAAGGKMTPAKNRPMTTADVVMLDQVEATTEASLKFGKEMKELTVLRAESRATKPAVTAIGTAVHHEDGTVDEKPAAG